MNPLETLGIETSVEGLVTPLAQALLHSLWQGAVVALLAAGALALVPRARVRARYGLACGALVLAVVLPVVTVLAMMPAPIMPASSASALEATPPPAGAPTANPSSVPLKPALTHTSGATLTAFLQPLQPWLVALWLVGVVFFTAWHVRSWRRAQALRWQGTKEVEARWSTTCARLARRLKIRRPVALLASVQAAVPATLGWLRPVVLVPVAAFHGLAPQQLEALIAHELAHVRRHDYLVNLFQVLAETLFFHSPAVWWLSHQVRREREHCCDELAVAVCGDRLLYARALTAAETLRSAPALAMAATGGDLLDRIRRLAGQPVARGRRADGALAGAALTFLLVSALVVATLVPSPTVDAAGAQGASAAEGESFEGRWEIEPQDDGRLSVSMRMRGSHGRWNNHFSLPADALTGRLTGQDATFSLRRDAGTFHFEGDFDGQGEGYGRFHFTADPAYAQAMTRFGYDGLTPRRQLELALHDVSLAYVEALADLGYRDLGLSKLIEMAIHGVEPDFIRALNGMGYEDVSASRLVELKIHGVSPDSIRALAAEGLDDLPLSRLVEMKIHGVDGQYVGSLRRAGFEGLSASKLVEMKIHGIDEGYIDGLQRVGLRDLSSSKLVEMKIHGVDAAFVVGLSELGYDDISASKLVEMKIHGVTPELIRQVQSEGYRDLTVNELIEMKIHGFDRFLARRDAD